jgi:hypothetical protein
MVHAHDLKVLSRYAPIEARGNLRQLGDIGGDAPLGETALSWLLAKPRWHGNHLRDVRKARCPVVEFADDGVEQIAQLEQSPIGALLLGDDLMNAGPKVLLAHPAKCLLDQLMLVSRLKLLQ